MTDDQAMLCVDARASRSLLGRFARGQSLQESLRALAREYGLRTAWISAIGAFEWIELTEYNQSTCRYEETHRFEKCELLSMQGNLSLRDGEPFWHVHATVSLRDRGHDVTYGGHVVDGRVFALEFRIECFDEVELRRTHDEATGLQLWEGPRSGTQQPEITRASEVTWAMAAEVSARVEPTSFEEAPQKGDWIEHAKFGLCKIEGLSGDGVCIIKLPDARRKKIKLDALRVLSPRMEGERRVFPVRGRGK